MKTLLVIFLFVLTSEGDYQKVDVVTQSFETEEQCNSVGRDLRILFDIPDEVNTLSYCVTEKEFRS